MPQNIPTIDTYYRRKDNHDKYMVEAIANRYYKGRHKKDYPITVLFSSRTTLLSLPLEKFNELMEEMPTR